MDATTPTQTLPEQEFPEAPVLVGEWKSTYLSTLLGQVSLSRHSINSIIHRMTHLHISRFTWYKANSSTNITGSLRTFEVASGSHWTPPTDRNAEGFLPTEHQHHYVIAEVSLPVPQDSPYHSLNNFDGPENPVRSKVLGHLRIEGTCRPNMPLVAVASSGSAVRRRSSGESRGSLGRLAPTLATQPQVPGPRGSTSRVTLEMLGISPLNLGPDFDSLVPGLGQGPTNTSSLGDTSSTPPTANSQVDNDEEPSPSSSNTHATPNARMQTRRMLTLETPTRGSSYTVDFKAGPSSSAQYLPSLGQASHAISTHDGEPTLTQEPDDLPTDDLADAVADRFKQVSYLHEKRSERSDSLRSLSSAASTASSLFISPWASRANSETRSRGGSTGSVGVATRPNSRSNSSNATSFTTRSSMSSVGLVFSNSHGVVEEGSRPVGQVRFVVMDAGSGDRQGLEDERILELSFPSAEGSPLPSSSVGQDGPRGFLTLRDLSILTDLVERSLKSRSTDDGPKLTTTDAASTNGDDSASEYAASEASFGSAPSELSIGVAARATCCCEFHKRLFDLIPRVSGLRVTESGGDEGGVRFDAAGEPGLNVADITTHHGHYSHHHGSLRAPFVEGAAVDGSDVVTLVQALNEKFNRRVSKFERGFIRHANSGDLSTWSTHDHGGHYDEEGAFGVVPRAAMQEARVTIQRLEEAINGGEPHLEQPMYTDEEA